LENQGYCNENYLVVADGVKYIVRKLLRDDIDRVFEWKVQNLAYEQGITAEPLVFDRENGFMIFAFLEGEHKSILALDELKVLAKTLQKLHNISIDAKPIKLQTDTSTVECYPKENVLCHNDLNPRNIFFPVGWVFQPTRNAIKLIDW
jgi:Ser/Thr protein kinase RdoA (MazF antagonist)